MTTVKNNNLIKEALEAFRAGDLSLTRDLTESLLARNPEEAGALRLLGQVEYLEGNPRKAAELMEKSLSRKPDQFSLWLKLGNALTDLGNYKKAETAYSEALGKTADPALGYFWRGQVRALMKQTGPAFEDLDRAVKANPYLGQAYRLMVRLGHPATQAQDFESRLLQKLSARLFPREDAIHAHYALAGYYEKSGEFDKMWYHLNQANGLQKNNAGPWQEAYSAIIERSKDIFNADFLNTDKKPSESDLTPVFIVGLPRSGSTLLERMLAGHPSVRGAGETQLIPKIIGKIQLETLLNYPNGVETLEPGQFGEFAKHYREEIFERVGKTKYSVDKLLSNAFFVGLILKMFPGAKFLHLKRDPLDNAFSIYKNHFWEGQSPEFCSLKDIGAYARMLEDMMAYWKEIARNAVLEVGYEKLVENPEEELKRVLKFLGLPWDKKCLAHQESETLANTLSTGQVDKPLTKASIGTGREHAQQLEAFMAEYKKNGTKHEQN